MVLGPVVAHVGLCLLEPLGRATGGEVGVAGLVLRLVQLLLGSLHARQALRNERAPAATGLSHAPRETRTSRVA